MTQDQDDQRAREKSHRDSLTGSALIHYAMDHLADDMDTDGETDAARCLRVAWRECVVLTRTELDALVTESERGRRALWWLDDQRAREKSHRDSLTGSVLIHYAMDHLADDMDTDGETDAARCLRVAWRECVVLTRTELDALVTESERGRRALWWLMKRALSPAGPRGWPELVELGLASCDGNDWKWTDAARAFAKDQLEREEGES